MPDMTEDDQLDSPAASDEPTTSVSRTPHRLEPTSHRWVAPVAVLLALAAVGLSIWALTNPPSDDSAADLTGDSKEDICTAFNTVTNAVALRTHTDLGPDPVPQEAVAANARLALVGGGQYLLSHLGSATPPELADAVRSFANDLQQIGIYALSGVPNTNPEQAERLTQGDLARKQVADFCE